MIRRTLLILLLLGGFTTLALGLFSYLRPIPAAGLWISSVQGGTRLQMAMQNGVLHTVLSSPHPTPGPNDREVAFGGFAARRMMVGQTLARGVGAPFWAIAAPLLAVPLRAAVRGPWQRRQRRRRGQCIRCGYDLRGSREPRCPECGAACRLPDSPTRLAVE